LMKREFGLAMWSLLSGPRKSIVVADETYSNSPLPVYKRVSRTRNR